MSFANYLLKGFIIGGNGGIGAIGGGEAGTVPYWRGIPITWPGKTRFGLVIWGLTCKSDPTGTLNLAAMPDKVSPG
jgi:hypothetical protein